MERRTALVTGASSGIGLATAELLARRGLRVGLLCRDPLRGERARQSIAEKTRNPGVELFLADLASQAEIRAVSRSILSAFPRLDILVNNAGAIFSARELSREGIEMTLATNYLSGYCLTQRLRPALEAAGQARVVNLSSLLHRIGRIRFSDPHFDRGYYVVWAYAQSKLAIVASTLTQAEQLRPLGIAVNCIDPGLARTGIGRGASRIEQRWAWNCVGYLGRSAHAAARDIVHVAMDPETPTGAYFVRRRVALPSRTSRDEALRARLEELTCGLVSRPLARHASATPSQEAPRA